MSSPETSGASAAEVLPFHRPQVPAPNPLDVDGDRADNWKIWKQRWDNYCIITGLLDQPEDYKCAMLLHSIGIEAMRIFNGLKFSDGEDRNNMADVIKKFDQHFLGQTQEFFERFQFNRRNQESGESIDEYVSVLRNMAKTCGFCDCMRELLIMDRILLGILDDKTHEELLSTHDLTLVKAIEICRPREAAIIHMRALKNEEINKVKGTQKQKKPRDRTKDKQHQTETTRATTKKCYFYKQVHAMRKESCPAWGKVCTSCGEKNHFPAPHHSQANGKCEAAVKVAKRMLRKTTKSGEDQYLALLNIRNVPTQGIDSSPAQRLFGRRTRTLLPTTQSQPRNPVNPESVHLRSNQERQAKYYNRTARDLPILKPGDTVRMKPFALGQKSWDKAHVTKRLVERSYEVQSAGTTFRCNRQHLVKTTQPTQFEQSVRDKATPNEIHDQQTSSNTRTSVVQTRPERTRLRPSPHRSLAGQKNGIPPLASHPQREKSPPHSLMQTRSGRIIKAPAKFKDYIMS